MRLREGEQVSSLAPVIGSDEEPDVDSAEEPDAEVLGPEGATAEPEVLGLDGV
jgi:hypothetical protein